MAIMKYNADHTGPNTQLGGLKEGFCNWTYQVRTDADVHTDPMAATEKHMPRKSANVSHGLLDV